MKISEYEKDGVRLYRDFADAVAAILDAAIRAQGKTYRYQHIQRRAKDPKSLRIKLEARGRTESENIESDIKDLAGCRVIFYSNGDVDAFVNSGILSANFEIDRLRSKPHHPVPGVTDPSNKYKGHNIVVALKADRSGLPEYARFAGLCCEVQIQTVLDHAWSDTAHDITYKRPKIAGVGSDLLKSIDVRLQKIMAKYIDPAGHQFQKVLNDYDQVLKAAELQETLAVDRLLACASNNERYDLLELISEYLIPHLDDFAGSYPAICDKIVRSITIARETPTQQRDIGGMKWEGVSVEEYARKASDTISKFAYHDVDGSFAAACLLYQEASTDSEREGYLAIAKNLAHHSIDAWEQVGPQIQIYLVATIQAMQPEQHAKLIPLIATVLEEVLSADLDGTSAKYNSITISMGAVAPSGYLLKLREDALALAFSLYESTQQLQDRALLRQAIFAATRTPHHGAASDALITIILENCADIVSFCARLVSKEHYEILISIEHDILWLKRWHQDLEAARPAVASAVYQFIQTIQSFRQILDADIEFDIFKTIIGYNAVFPPMWDDKDFDLHGIDAYRRERVDSFIERINAENSAVWFERLRRCASAYTAYPPIGGSLPYFLDKLGATKPIFALACLAKDDESVAAVASYILCGLEKGSGRTDAIKLATSWVGAEKNIAAVAEYLRCHKPIMVDLLSMVLAAALNQSREDVVLQCLEVCFEPGDTPVAELEQRIMLPAIKFLSSIKKSTWINIAWFRTPKLSILHSCTEGAVDELLQNLVFCPKIDYRSEGVLVLLAKRLPEKVIDYFARRISYGCNADREDKYDAIPYEFKELAKPLQKAAKYLVETAKSLYEVEEYKIKTRAVRLVANTFPDDLSSVHKDLVDLANDRAGADFVLSILREYEGEQFLHELCKDLVEVLPQDEALISEVRTILWNSGVVSGPFGFVDAYRRKTDEMRLWLTDRRTKVRQFAESVIDGYAKDMAVEQRRAEQDLEMRKLDWRDDEESKPASKEGGK